jgi:hypothetical protein
MEETEDKVKSNAKFRSVRSRRGDSVKSRLLKKFPSSKSKQTTYLVLLSVVVVIAGVASGWLLSNNLQRISGGKSGKATTSKANGDLTEAGISDESAFPDSAEGELEKGGIDGEGTHHLVREGGEARYVYLTSTVIDLESFVGKKVKVWGESIAAEHAGWLMDVGKIKRID